MLSKTPRTRVFSTIGQTFKKNIARTRLWPWFILRNAHLVFRVEYLWVGKKYKLCTGQRFQKALRLLRLESESYKFREMATVLWVVLGYTTHIIQCVYIFHHFPFLGIFCWGYLAGNCRHLVPQILPSSPERKTFKSRRCLTAPSTTKKPKS